MVNTGFYFKYFLRFLRVNVVLDDQNCVSVFSGFFSFVSQVF